MFFSRFISGITNKKQNLKHITKKGGLFVYSNTLQKLLREALLNNTYDKPSMEGAIKMTLENSYNYLYHLQKQYVGFEERHYTTGGLLSRKDPIKPGQLYVNRYSYACVDIDFEIIDVPSMERYRRSSFYREEFGLQDMIDHPEIFAYIPILMIDGMVIEDWKICLRNLDNNCTFRLLKKRRDFVLYNKRKFQLDNPDYDKNKKTGELRLSDADSEVYKEHRIDVFIYENEARLTKYTGKAGIINSIVSAENNRKYVSFLSERIRQLGNRDADPDKGMFFLSIHLDTGSNIISTNPPDAFLLIPTEDNTSDKKLWSYLLPPKVYRLLKLYPDTNITIQPYYMKGIHLYKHLEFNKDTRYYPLESLEYIDIDTNELKSLIDHQIAVYKENGFGEIFDFQVLIDNGMATTSVPLNSAIVKNRKTLDEMSTDGMLVKSPDSSDTDDTIPSDFQIIYNDELSDTIPLKSLVISDGADSNELNGGEMFIHSSDINYGDYGTGYDRYTITEIIKYPEVMIDNNETKTDRIPYVIVKDNYKDFMVIEREDYVPYAMPIAKENILLFREKSVPTVESDYVNQTDALLHLDHTKGIDEYYPNIYSYNYDMDDDIEVGDTIWTFYFYHEAESLQYTPMHHWYYRFLSHKFGNRSIEDVITRIYNDDLSDLDKFTENERIAFQTVFEEILNYKHFKHQYGEVDFLYNYQPLEENIEKLPIEYKIETLRKWIREEPFVLRDYVIEQNRVSKIYYIYTNTIDLEARIRYDDSLEAHGSTTFDEPHYVFAFANTRDKYPETINCRVFVDGLFIHEIHQIRYMNLDYIYIPTRYFEYGAYVEVEVFPQYVYEHEITFASTDDWKEFILDKPDYEIFPTRTDMYAYDEEGLQYDDSVFDIVSIYPEGEYEVSAVPTFDVIFETYDEYLSYEGKFKENNYYYCRENDQIYFFWNSEIFNLGSFAKLHPVQFTRLRQFRIRPKFEDVVGKKLTIRFTKYPFGFPIKFTEEGYPTLTVICRDFKFQPTYVRIFKNNRLLSRNRYTFIGNYNNPDQYPVIQILEKCTPDDQLYLDITPFTYKEIFYKEELSKDELLVDLKEYITKPYDARYYECYLNGRRMSVNNIMAIEPWAITFVNLHSLYSLVIFEKERDWEYFGVDYKENLYGFTPSDLLNQPFMTDQDKTDLIKDFIEKIKDPDLIIHPNTNDEDRLPNEDLSKYLEMYYFYFNELIPKGFINPDRVQFSTESMLHNYDAVYHTYSVLPYDESGVTRKMYYPEVLILDPDKMIQSVDNESKECALFSVGHPPVVDQEYLDQDISIEANRKDGDISTVLRDVTE